MANQGTEEQLATIFVPDTVGTTTANIATKDPTVFMPLMAGAVLEAVILDGDERTLNFEVGDVSEVRIPTHGAVQGLPPFVLTAGLVVTIDGDPGLSWTAEVSIGKEAVNGGAEDEEEAEDICLVPCSVNVVEHRSGKTRQSSFALDEHGMTREDGSYDVLITQMTPLEEGTEPNVIGDLEPANHSRDEVLRAMLLGVLRPGFQVSEDAVVEIGVETQSIRKLVPTRVELSAISDSEVPGAEVVCLISLLDADLTARHKGGPDGEVRWEAEAVLFSPFPEPEWTKKWRPVQIEVTEYRDGEKRRRGTFVFWEVERPTIEMLGGTKIVQVELEDIEPEEDQEGE